MAFLAALIARADYIKNQGLVTKLLIGTSFISSMLYAPFLYYVTAFSEAMVIRALHTKYAPGGNEGVAQSIQFYKMMTVLLLLAVIEIWLAFFVGISFMASVLCFFIDLYFQ